MRRLAVLSLFLVVLAACDEDTTASGGDQGVRGIVLLGPTCPVEREDSPCPDRPMADVEVRALRDGEEVTTARSGDDGRFEMALPPGEYVLEAVLDSGGGPPTAKPVQVTVVANAYADVQVLVDSGIR